MRLAEFIRANIEPILQEWETFARSLLPGANMTVLALRDDAESILLATIRDMQHPQSLGEQARKSKGDGGAGGAASQQLDRASELHGVDRVESGFHITDVVAEYRALRASVLRLWRQSEPQANLHDIDDITRFNEALDQSLARGVESYSKRIDEARQLFLAILSHDLRNPLNCIRMAADLVSVRHTDQPTGEALSIIETNTKSALTLISDLIDFSSSKLGRHLPMKREQVDLEKLCHEVVEGFRTTYPQRAIEFSSTGEVHGIWDAGRMRQVISNLLGNALQHGSPTAAVKVTLAAEEATVGEAQVVIRVHNQGSPIPPEALPTIFDPLKRFSTREAAHQHTPGSIGLGLYIVREIVEAKRGTIEITSNDEEGTTFTVKIPRAVSG